MIPYAAMNVTTVSTVVDMCIVIMCNSQLIVAEILKNKYLFTEINIIT